MPLSWLAGVGNFCFNSLSPFLSIVRILSCQVISFQILHALFSRFPWSTLLPFPSYFKLHNLTYAGVDISKDDMTIPPQTALNYLWSSQQDPPYSKEHQSTPYRPISPHTSAWSSCDHDVISVFQITRMI